MLERRHRAPAGGRLHVTAPQFPETSLADDVARLRQVLSRQDGPTIVAGHSYGGQIMTALGADAPNVVGLVYIAAFGLDEGESLGALLGGGPPTPALAHLIVDEQGFAWLPEDDFVEHFAADVDPAKARVLYAVQQALSMSTFEDVMGVPAWKSQPSWYLVATDDQAIPPDAERMFAQRMGATTVEVPSSHLAMVSHPDEVVELISAAAAGARRHRDRAPAGLTVSAMPMIDVYATAGTFTDKHALAQRPRRGGDALGAGAGPGAVSRQHRRVRPRPAGRLDLQRRRGEQLRARSGADPGRRARPRQATRCRQGADRDRRGGRGRPDARRSERGCCSPNRPRAAGESRATPTPAQTLPRPPGRSSQRTPSDRRERHERPRGSGSRELKA